jgi:hypothetical protein
MGKHTKGSLEGCLSTALLIAGILAGLLLLAFSMKG